ncbi:MAG: PASTA domain-containing protein [Burkholderiales bacterium]|nr:PASTA domain-containing protein [Burkholderiales bacterium]
MSLVKPALSTALPGKPITAQAWNEITAALGSLFDAVNALGGATVRVQVASNGQPVPGAVVLAVPGGEGRPVTAVPPYPGVLAHTVTGVTEGSWTLHVSAPGFVSQAIAVTVPIEATLSVNLVPAGVAMPDLFAMPASQALTALAAAGIVLDLVLDAAGQELPKTSLPPASANVPVLAQQPPAGSIVVPSTGRARLVLAASFQQESVVVMPNLSGLSLAEATKALEGLGLKVGTTTIKT